MTPRHLAPPNPPGAGSGAKHGPLPSLRARLLLWLLLPSFVGAALVAAILVNEYRQGLERSRQGSLFTARALAQAVDNQLGEIQSGLSGLAAGGALHPEDFAAFHARASVFAKSLHGMGNVVLADTGSQLVNTQVPFGGELPRTGPGSPASIVIGSGRPFARVVKASLTGRWIVVAGVPVRVDGTVRYAMSSGVNPDLFQQLLVRQQLPAAWFAVVLDDQQLIVARTAEAATFRGQPASASFREALARGREGVFEGVTLEGVPVVTAFSRSSDTGWAVAVAIPREELAGELRHSLAILGAVVLSILALAGALAWANGRHVARSLSKLLALSTQLGRGERLTNPDLPYAETQQLAQALVHASETQAEARRDIEDRQIRLRAVLDSAVDGIVVADGNQRIVEFNPAAQRLFGYERDEVIGLPLEILVPERNRPGHSAGVARFIAEGGAPRPMDSTGKVLHALRSDGTEFPMEGSIAAVTVRDGQVLTVIVRDITARLAVQDALLRSNEELQHYAAVASHDLRSPLRSIKGFLTVLSRSEPALTERQRELIARCQRAADHMDHLTGDLLAYARLQRSTEPRVDVDLGTVVSDAIDLLRDPIRDSGARIDVKPMPVVRAAASEMVRLFENLISNAIKYRGSLSPVIEVSAQAQPDAWVVSIRDNGAGIAPDYRERVFELFERLQNEGPPGTGVGLAICRRIVQRHGGRIWVESAPGGGSVFRFTLAREGANHG
jgi:PAS domain S-box-containing protein